MIDFRFGRVDVLNFYAFCGTCKHTTTEGNYFAGESVDRENDTSPETVPQTVVVGFVAESGFYQIFFLISFL